MEPTPAEQRLRDQAFALEREGRLEDAAKAWGLLEGRTGAIASVAKTRGGALRRRFADRRRAEQLLAQDDEEIIDEAIAAAEAADRWSRVVEVRRLQAARDRNADTLIRLGGALRRAGELDEAAAVLSEARALEPGSRPAATAWAALLRARGNGAGARALLEQLRAAHRGDPAVAATLAAVELDDADRLGDRRHLDAAEALLKVVYAQHADQRETRALYGRLDALRRRLG